MSWYETYLSLPWKAYATGPDAFDCWGLVSHCLRHHYGIEVDRYADVAFDDMKAIDVKAALEIKSRNWNKCDSPEDGCVVLMSEKKCIHHIGLFVDGAVLHVREGADVCLETIETLRLIGFNRIEFWKWAQS